MVANKSYKPFQNLPSGPISVLDQGGQSSKEFNIPLKASDINCDGCKTENGRLFGFCQMCEVRACGQQKKVETCAHCDEFECHKILGIFKMIPYARDALEKVKATL